MHSPDALDHHSPAVTADSPLESLGLSVRARNALRAVGCSTVDDVLGLDLDRPIRGLGRKAKEELLKKLGDAGFSDPADGDRASEIKLLERSLERMQARVDAALGMVAKEIRSAKDRVRRLKPGAPQTS